MIEVGLACTSDIRVDYKRGILLIQRVRVAEWSKSSGLVYNVDRLKGVGIDVPLDKLEKAVQEEMNE